MAHEFRLPDIGEGLTEVTVLDWLIGIGDEVALDAPLVELETDKAVTEIPAPAAGVLLHQGAGPGETLQVGEVLAVIGEAGEEWEPAAQAPSGAQALPAVRKLAAELGVDVAGIAGTGPEGRVTEDDVRGAAESGPVERAPLSPVRKAIADHLGKSWREIPHVTTYGDADAEPLLAARGKVGGVPLEALLIHALAPLLAEHPEFNATLSGDSLLLHKRYDIGFAVDTPDGLMVAVVREAAGRSVDDLASEVRRLVEAAQGRTAAPDELRGQTFTISNIGAVGGRYGTPIVPYGTTAILSVGRADPAAGVLEGELAVVRRFPLSLSYDHRVVDGAMGRRFLAAVVEALEGA